MTTTASRRGLPAADISRTNLARKIHFVGPAFNYSGYARVTRELLPELLLRGNSVKFDGLTADQKFLDEFNRNQAEVRLWRSMLDREQEEGVIFVFHPPVQWNGYPIFQSQCAKRPGHRARIGITMFETDRLPPRWAAECNMMDEVWVPSKFNFETFLRAGVQEAKLRVVPLGIDGTIYAREERRYRLPEPAGFNFLSIFQWTARKGWDVLLEAYLQAFTRRDDVSLTIRAYPSYKKDPPIAERVAKFLADRGFTRDTAPRIQLIDRFVSDAEMPSLYRAADAYVLPTRGEGWGLPFMEAMAAGLPTIGTRWGAQTDFMDDQNSFLIDIDGVCPVAKEQVEEDPYYGHGQNWAAPSVEHLASTMRWVFEHRDEGRVIGKRGQADVLTKWNREKCAMAFERLYDQVLLRSPRAVERPLNLSPAKMIWLGPLWDPSGYAEEGRGFVAAIDDAGGDIAGYPVHWTKRTAELDPRDVDRLLRNESRPPANDAFVVQHAFPPFFRLSDRPRITVGRTMFETDRIPANWVAPCNLMDEIWVPGDFNIETFTASGVRRDKLWKLPGSIDEVLYAKDHAPLRFAGRRGFNFLSIFDWSRRKAWDVMVRAFVEEFSVDDDVALFLKVHSSIGKETSDLLSELETFVRRDLGRSPDRLPTILLLDDEVPAIDMPSLHLAADCYLMPSRGEGWGRPAMEALAVGVPTIATRWGGQIEFMHDQNSRLVAASMVDVSPQAVAEAGHFRGHRWAEPSLIDLRAAMREAFEDRRGTLDRAARGRDEILTRFARPAIAAMILERADYLAAKIRG